MNVVLGQAYPSRIAAIETLTGSSQYAGGAELRARAEEVVAAAELFGKAETAKNWRAFAIALEILGLLADWSEAVHTAAVDADRFVRAARLRYRNFKSDAAQTGYGQAVVAALAPIDAEFEVETVPAVRAAIAGLEMPVGIFSIEDRNNFGARSVGGVAAGAEEIAVAFLEFAIDGNAAETFHSLSAGQVHDLDLTIRVSRWPDDAERLVIGPVSIEPASTWDFPTFEFARPDGPPPYVFQRQGRMALHAAQGFNARPLEFRYAAEFKPRPKHEESIVVAGQRTLRLDGTDTSRLPLTGYGELDAKIVQLRDRLRLEPMISETDLRDLLALLIPVGNLMGQAVQDKRYPQPINEAAFQADFQSFLRANSAIGSELEVQGHVAGGRVDLTFRGIRIELKSERYKRLLPDDCKQFAEQAASYAVGSGRRVALLCVLDSSVKSQAPFPVADGLTIVPVDTGTSPVYVVSCLFQGGLPRPSDLSR
ncbi:MULTISPECIES: hypothetical protein [Rhizobium]|uniref:Uncharacterized protein n=1 Tax=Rhizobium leguminosarum bv. viciae TaxID=387 RepID=A0A8G2MLU4_RHILV|nr:hypothetical protein [Rhizobium leguminosarum]NKK11586.1 hypothetical protein [Rhizobium leguminosarum bv. viciae]NKK25569.1 hypothetical protein [Rhizobium leguminosarum bv. viciae]TBX84882.1 hypothetical protein E0H31_36145 [Rhizobium leguminosarum bv. viciae]TBZ07808.1 hypothetical protein E0H52_36750 [Rhizobium leguminosarum bv. viciae]